ncbi:isopenicillin N synthase family oxygenase [Kovacikia minuta CCNUW1]|uniref:isopenicillin N synthase family dioxygenase n=1 Tax=Kovacikia minuta TaxID=2931930 RepID=UPI001CCB6C8A|nr:2-oxoglutarate and iron-dependent oxygenase domain-containing protein [Kovacikia minuta]UBF25539.1 isopenicillin N synthase family oxygenase [Kovacikia minuta CCNUW1]
MPTQTIPVLNLQDFRADASHRKAFIAQLGGALEDIGFFAVTNHDVDPQLIRTAYRLAQEFFELPEDIKRRYENPAVKGQRGFTQFGREHAKDSPFPDLKEFWHVGRELPPDHPLACRYPKNLSPLEIPQFHPVMSQLYAQLEACAVELLRACACYLGEPENLLSDMVQDSDTILRIIHYPPIVPGTHPARLRSAPHEDINLITLLCEATTEGLELLQRDGQWRSISAVPGQIIVDSGDMLHQLTNGLMQSTTHRVTNPTNDQESRFSMPFFVHSRADVDLTPLPICVSKTGNPPLPSITAGAYLQQRLQEIGLAD